ncbi:MAG: T9SS type A sorting domain-containing protein [Saprospiraceae bacterium]|nr:T9SS type A sorting domain-containing protein [Saprospiraceae bacterium]
MLIWIGCFAGSLKAQCNITQVYNFNNYHVGNCNGFTFQSVQSYVAYNYEDECNSHKYSSPLTGGAIITNLNIVKPTSLSVNPIPALDYIIIQSNINFDNAEIEIYNSAITKQPFEVIMKGSQIMKIDIHQLISGIYFLRIHENSNPTILSFIKL